jgi:triosephosphate isomerase
MLYFVNWKLNLNLDETIALAHKYLNLNIPEGDKITLIPSIFALGQVMEIVGEKYNVYSQDVSLLVGEGGMTGEVTATTLKENGVHGSLLGHMERRMKSAETSIQVKQKIANCIQEDMNIVLSIGEFGKDQFTLDESLTFLKNEINTLLGHFPAESFSKLVLAYEDPEKISSLTSDIVTINYEELHKKIQYIKSILNSDLHGPMIPVVYGGSVNPTNVNALKSMGILDGFLIGKASLDINQMQAILNA